MKDTASLQSHTGVEGRFTKCTETSSTCAVPQVVLLLRWTDDDNEYLFPLYLTACGATQVIYYKKTHYQ